MGRADRVGGQVRGRVAALVIALVTVGMAALPVGAAAPAEVRLPGKAGGAVELAFEGAPALILPKGGVQEFTVKAHNASGKPARLEESRLYETFNGSIADPGIDVEILRDGDWQTAKFAYAFGEDHGASTPLAEPLELAPGESATVARLRLNAGSVDDGYLRHGSMTLNAAVRVADTGPDGDPAAGTQGLNAFASIDLVAAVYFDGFSENWVPGAPARELTVRVAENLPESASFRWNFAMLRSPVENEECLVSLEAFDPRTSQWRRETTHEFPLAAYATGPPGDQTLRLRLALSDHFPSYVVLNYGISDLDEAPIRLANPQQQQWPPVADSPENGGCASPAGHLAASPPATASGSDANGPEAQAGSAGHPRRPLRYAAAGALILALGAVAFAQRRKKRA